MNRANLKRRVLTGMLGGTLLLLSALHELSYLSVFVVIIFLSSREYYKILSNNGFKPNYNLVLKKYDRAVICLDKDASRIAFSITKEINIPSTMRFLKRDLKHCTPDDIQKLLS